MQKTKTTTNEAVTNTSGNLLEVDGFKVEQTGGGNTGLLRTEKLNGFIVEFLITDDNLSFPAEFPCEISSWFRYDDPENYEYIYGNSSDFLDGEVVEDMDELENFIEGTREYINQNLNKAGILKCNDDGEEA